MSRPGKQAAAARLAVAVQLVGSVCALLLAVCLALSFTLLREGHFAACLKKSGYLDTVHAAVLDTCSQYAAAMGTTADPLANAITPDVVYAGVMHRADSLWHGSTNDETDPFGRTPLRPSRPLTMATAFYSITAKWSGRVRWQRRFRRR